MDRKALSWPQFLFAAGVVIAVVFAFLNPEPSRSLPLPARIVFWAAHVGLLLSLMQAIQLALSWLPPAARASGWIGIGVAGLAGAAIFAPIAVLLDRVFGLAAVTDDLTQPLGLSVLEEFSSIAPPAVFTWLGLNAIKGLPLQSMAAEAATRGANPPAASGAAAPEDPAPAMPAFMARLPAALGQDLVALSAELHYLRVETTRGNALILYPFNQAVADLAASATGAQIHRSHWVADAHVAGLKREGAQMVCVLDSGTRLPVGRRRRAEIVSRFSGSAAAAGDRDASRPPRAADLAYATPAADRSCRA